MNPDYEADLQRLVEDLKGELTRVANERDAALSKCDCILFTVESLVYKLSTDEQSQNLHSVQAGTSAGSLLNNGVSGKANSPEPLQEMRCCNNEGESPIARVSGTKGSVVAREEKSRSKEVQKIPTGLSENSSGQEQAGLSKTEPLQGEMSHGPAECGCKRADSEAENLSGVRVVGDGSRAPRRLQQAIRSAVALQHLSRQEAQEILSLYSSDCGKGRHSPEEWDTMQRQCAEMREAIQFCNCAYLGGGHGPVCETQRHIKLEHALSTDCGKGFVHVTELEPTKKFLRGLLQVTSDFLDDETGHYTKATQAELARLEALPK